MTRSADLECHEVLRRLDDFLDRELASDEIRAVERHLDRCAQCAREARFEASVLAGIRHKLRRIQLPSDLAQRIRAGLAQSRDPGA